MEMKRKKKSVCFIVMHTETGMPLFIRNINHKKEIPEVVVISLNSVHSFCQSFSINLVKTYAGHQVVFWNTFHHNLMLILVLNHVHGGDGGMGGRIGGRDGGVKGGEDGGIYGEIGEDNGAMGGDDDWLYRRLFMLLQRCMTLKTGEEKLEGSYENIKMALEMSIELVDSVLLAVLCDASSLSSLSLLTLSTSISQSPQHQSLQVKLEDFSNKWRLDTVAIFVVGQRVAATKKYINLPPTTASLLQFLVCHSNHKLSSSSLSSSSSSFSSESVVFVSEVNSSSVLRLLTLELTADVVLCVLCGTKPSLQQLTIRTETLWVSELSQLRHLSEVPHLPLPKSVIYNKHLLGYIVICRKRQTALICADVHNHSQHPNVGRMSWLMEWFKDSNNLFYNNNNNNNNNNNDADLEMTSTTTSHITTTYTCGSDYKGYCMGDCGGYDVWLLFHSQIPVYVLKSASRTFVDSIKEISWIEL